MYDHVIYHTRRHYRVLYTANAKSWTNVVLMLCKNCGPTLKPHWINISWLKLHPSFGVQLYIRQYLSVFMHSHSKSQIILCYSILKACMCFITRLKLHPSFGVQLYIRQYLSVVMHSHSKSQIILCYSILKACMCFITRLKLHPSFGVQLYIRQYLSVFMHSHSKSQIILCYSILKACMCFITLTFTFIKLTLCKQPKTHRTRASRERHASRVIRVSNHFSSFHIG